MGKRKKDPCHQAKWKESCAVQVIKNPPEIEREFTHLRKCCSHTFRETNSLRRTMQIVECSLLHRRAQGRVFLAKDPDQFL